MTDVVMPQMGESIVEGTLTKWLKKPGERVERDEPLFEISTDKVDTEIPSPAAGTLAEILVEEGKTVGINTVVARIEEGGAAAAKPKARRGRRPRLRSLRRRPSRRRSGSRVAPAARSAAGGGVRCRPSLPARSRRWCARWRARTISTCRACAAPAPADASPSRTWRPISAARRPSPRRRSRPLRRSSPPRRRPSSGCSAASAGNPGGRAAACRRAGPNAHRADEHHAAEDRRAHGAFASAPRRTSPPSTAWI